jgi:hypothetical protein
MIEKNGEGSSSSSEGTWKGRRRQCGIGAGDREIRPGCRSSWGLVSNGKEEIRPPIGSLRVLTGSAEAIDLGRRPKRRSVRWFQDGPEAA